MHWPTLQQSLFHYEKQQQLSLGAAERSASAVWIFVVLFHQEEAFQETAAELPVHVRQVKVLSEDFWGRMQDFLSLPRLLL